MCVKIIRMVWGVGLLNGDKKNAEVTELSLNVKFAAIICIT